MPTSQELIEAWNSPFADNPAMRRSIIEKLPVGSGPYRAAQALKKRVRAAGARPSSDPLAAVLQIIPVMLHGPRRKGNGLIELRNGQNCLEVLTRASFALEAGRAAITPVFEMITVPDYNWCEDGLEPIDVLTPQVTRYRFDVPAFRAALDQLSRIPAEDPVQDVRTELALACYSTVHRLTFNLMHDLLRAGVENCCMLAVTGPDRDGYDVVSD